jgi:regulator of replication initiation timing
MLTKLAAISEHSRLQRDVLQTRESIAAISQEAETSRREANTLRLENTQLRTEVARLNGFVSQGRENHRSENPIVDFNDPQYDGRSNYVSGSSRLGDVQSLKNTHGATSLPPIRSLPANHGMGEDMTGVQYNDTPMQHLGGYHDPPQSRPTGYGQPETRMNGFQQRPAETRPGMGFQQPQRSF